MTRKSDFRGPTNPTVVSEPRAKRVRVFVCIFIKNISSIIFYKFTIFIDFMGIFLVEAKHKCLGTCRLRLPESFLLNGFVLPQIRLGQRGRVALDRKGATHDG